MGRSFDGGGTQSALRRCDGLILSCTGCQSGILRPGPRGVHPVNAPVAQ